jgi:hypothetical protein
VSNLPQRAPAQDWGAALDFTAISVQLLDTSFVSPQSTRAYQAIPRASIVSQIHPFFMIGKLLGCMSRSSSSRPEISRHIADSLGHLDQVRFVVDEQRKLDLLRD